MKKTVISLMLALALVFSLVLVAAPAAQAAGHTDHCVCGGKTAGVGDHTTCTTLTGWTELTSAYITETLLEGKSTSELDTTDGTYVKHPTVDNQSKVPVINLPAGNYYLSADLEVPYALRCDGEVTICLNGHNLKGNTAKTDGFGRVFIQQGKVGTLNLTDCTSNPGTVSASTNDENRIGGVILLNHADAVYNIYGGIIEGATTKQGGAINATGGATINMYGGTIQGGKVAASAGNVYVYQGALNMHGGTIQGGDAGAHGGNVLIHGKATLNMTGGSILNGTAVNASGNVCAVGTLNISGGTISGGTTDLGMTKCDIGLEGGTLVVENLDATTYVKINSGSADLSKMDSSLTKTGTDDEFTLTKAAAPSTPGTGDSPATGDSANLVVMGLGLVLGVAGMACLLPKKQNV